MKQLKLTINGEVKTFDLPKNGEYKCEVTESYVPKVGDCVRVETKDENISYWCKLTSVTSTTADFKISVNSSLKISKKGFFGINEYRIYTKITPEELKAKYAEAGYDWDYATDTIKSIKWMPENAEYKCEVTESCVPKVGDCVMIKSKETDILYWCKITFVTNIRADFKICVDSNLKTYKNGFFHINENRIYTKITPEELKAKYAEAGYDWDYESDTIKPIKWMPKNGDYVWLLNSYLEPDKIIFRENGDFDKNMLEKGLLFQTEEECQKFADHCLSYFENKNK